MSRASLATMGLAAALLLPACSGNDAMDPEGPFAPAATPSPRASFELWGTILGPVTQDDRSDIRISLRESAGVGANLNFVRLTCTNRSSQEWGAGSFVEERGSNRIESRETLVFERSYFCSSSARPQEILANLTDDHGHEHTVIAAPVHPDWPGS